MSELGERFRWQGDPTTPTVYTGIEHTMITPKEEQRAPMMTDAFIDRAIREVEQGDYRIGLKFGYKSGRDFYEAKITSGELRVVKKVTPTRTFADGRWWEHHSCCGRNFDKPVDGDHCPGCGAQIVKA